MKVDYLVVGAGFSGTVISQQLAKAGKSVCLVDKRPHIGGNAYDCHDENGILIHPYGPHIFHTNSKRIIDYLSQFTEWRFYEHRVLAEVEGRKYPLPINRKTINALYGSNFTEYEVMAYFEKVRTPITTIKTSQDVVLNSVGHDLCEKFFRNYTRKQWGLDLSELSAGVAARIPTRTNDDDRYFTDTYQFMPANGYTAMFQNMLDHSNIQVHISTSLDQAKAQFNWEHLIYTGPIDAFFNHQLGKLPYRSLSFEHEHLAQISNYQPVGTVNYPNDHAYTRITEFKHLTGQICRGTSIVREYPNEIGDPYYPIPRSENDQLYQQYLTLANKTPNVTFIGRLAEYKYYNMDQVVASALKKAGQLIAS
jgi:UDP-galactopyranose mutase